MAVHFETRKMNPKAIWSSDFYCFLCNNHIMAPCKECELHATSECTVAWGQCNHAFHYHCISKWFKKSYTCPIDKKEWVFQKVPRLAKEEHSPLNLTKSSTKEQLNGTEKPIGNMSKDGFTPQVSALEGQKLKF